MMRKGLLISAALGIMPLAAQEPGGVSVAGFVALGSDSTKSFTGENKGFAVEAAYDLAGDVPVRFGLGVSRFGAGERDYTVITGQNQQYTVRGPGISLTTLQLYAALRTNPFPKTFLLFGLSANRHRLGMSDDTENVKGIKFGARLDLEYRFSSSLTGTLAFQGMEVGLDEVGTRIESPNWIQAGVRFHF